MTKLPVAVDAFGCKYYNINMILLRNICIIGAILGFSGCYSLSSSQWNNYSTGEEHVLVSNYGWYLFGVVPIACGNAAKNPVSPWAFFRNDVTMNKLQRNFMDYAETRVCEPTDLFYYTRDSVLFSIPGSSLPIPIPYILTYKEIQLSGVLK